MFLDTLPLVFILAGVVLYVALGGADFGAGIWQVLAGRGPHAQEIGDHAHHSMGPVWEANHVWLIFVITVTWTAYPVFLGSLASTLGVAFFIAGLGVILRGASYALRTASTTRRQIRVIDGAFALASLVTPFTLGAAAGAVAALRVPVGNAQGAPFASWLNPTSIMIGALAVVFSTYMAAVFLSADAARRDEPEVEVEEAYRRRALAAGAVAGALSVVGLVVVHGNAPSLYRELTHGAALAVMIASVLLGAATMALVLARRFELARIGAGAAVAAVIAAWAFARYPLLLPGLTVRQAAAGHDTLICLVVAILAGGALLFPALGLLFTLTLRGHLGSGTGAPHDAAEGSPPPLRGLLAPALGARVAVALLIVGIGMLNAADAKWAHVIGVFSLFGFIIVAFIAILPRALADDPGVAH